MPDVLPAFSMGEMEAKPIAPLVVTHQPDLLGPIKSYVFSK